MQQNCEDQRTELTRQQKISPPKLREIFFEIRNPQSFEDVSELSTNPQERQQMHNAMDHQETRNAMNRQEVIDNINREKEEIFFQQKEKEAATQQKLTAIQQKNQDNIEIAAQGIIYGADNILPALSKINNISQNLGLGPVIDENTLKIIKYVTSTIHTLAHVMHLNDANKAIAAISNIILFTLKGYADITDHPYAAVVLDVNSAFVSHIVTADFKSAILSTLITGAKHIIPAMIDDPHTKQITIDILNGVQHLVDMTSTRNTIIKVLAGTLFALDVMETSVTVIKNLMHVEVHTENIPLELSSSSVTNTTDDNLANFE